jgi:hypothetical protein
MDTTMTAKGSSISQAVRPMSCSRLAWMQTCGQISSRPTSCPSTGTMLATTLAAKMTAKPIQKSLRPIRPSAVRKRVFQSMGPPEPEAEA